MTTVETPLSRSKIVVPALRPEILHRARLLALFDDLLDRKLIIVAAPAGYGKTSLLADFARQSGMPVCWLSLDALDSDPQRFCAYLIAALEQTFPGFGQQSESALRSLTSLEQDTERLLSVLVNEIDSQIDEHFALVVDDYQFVDAIPYIRDLFSRFVYLVGENCHVILSSRRLPTLPDITIMVARQQVSGFDLEQLAFRPDEIRSFFEINYGIALADNSLEELVHQTEGWITGLLLSASSATRGVPDLTLAARAVGVDLAAYLNQQVLAPQPASVRKFLLQTSLLEEFDASLCEAVLGKGDWKSLINTVRQNNLFVLPVGQDGKWVRYHHLFQEFLQGRIREEEPERAQTILSRLADVYKERNEWEKAYAIYRQIRNLNALADLIELAGTPMLLNERLITLRTWLEELPPALLEERLSLLSLKSALLSAVGNGQGALMLLDRTIPRLRESGDLSGLALALVRRAAAHRLVGDYEKSLQDADEAMTLSRNKAILLKIFAEAERFKGICLYHQGKPSEAVRFQEDALRLYEQMAEEQSVAWLQTELGMTYRAVGKYVDAQNVYNLALAELKRQNNLPSQANVLNSLGVLYHFQGEYEQAVKAFEAGLECARYSGSLWQEAFLLASLGDVYLDLDEYESAVQAYANATQIAMRVNYQFLTNYLNLVQARVARLRGRMREAHHHLRETEPLVQAAGSNFEYGLFYLELGSLYLKEGNYTAAVNNLEQALNYFQNGGLNVESAWSRIWLSAAFFTSGKIMAARSCLQAVLGPEQSQIGFYPLLSALRQVEFWLAPFQTDAEIGPLLISWLERVRETEACLPGLHKRLRHLFTTVPIQAPRLTIRAFGRARVRVNGKWMTSAQWKTASVRELFFYILAAHRPVTKEEIGETLWPDLDIDQLKLRFKNDLYRLRHALGQDVVLFENGAYHFNQLLDYEYDVENFVAQLAKAMAARQVEDKISLLHNATGLRSGAYLHDIDATWVLAERERLDRACIDALKQLAEAHRQMGNPQSALQACQDALKIDACREDIHRLAMQLYADQGDRLSVIWQYQACRDTLLADLDVTPSAKTQTLYRQLIG